jgi:ABC-type glycerol-3-phosphate transport system permease component
MIDDKEKQKISTSDTKKGFDRTAAMMHVFLLLLGLFVSSPILLAFFTSFKVPEKIIEYPPNLIPMRQRRVELDGYEDPLMLYDATQEDGTVLTLALVEQNGNLVQMLDPENPDSAMVTFELNQITSSDEVYFTLENYVTAWTTVPFLRFFINSIIQTGTIVLFQVLFSILAAYAFSILDFPGRDLLFYVILGSLMVPFQLTFIPNFILISKLGWINTYQGLTVPFLASAFGVFLLRQFFLSLPRDLYDAAKVDGASSWRYLWQIVVPLSKGAISALVTFSFLAAWGQFLWPLVITNQPEMRTIQIGIRFFLADQERGADWGAIMAGAIIALLPTMILFLVAQKQLVRGIASTGLKG